MNKIKKENIFSSAKHYVNTTYNRIISKLCQLSNNYVKSSSLGNLSNQKLENGTCSIKKLKPSHSHTDQPNKWILNCNFYAGRTYFLF